ATPAPISPRRRTGELVHCAGQVARRQTERRWKSKNFLEKYRRFTGRNARQLQCKALRNRQKIRRRKNRGEQGKNKREEQSEQSEIRACLCPVATPEDRRRRCARRRCRADRCVRDLRMIPGAQFRD